MVSDRWFAFRVWCRYDMLWTRSGRSVLLLAFLCPLALVAALGVPALRGGGTVAAPPVALPLTTIAPSRVSDASAPGGVLVVGDSLVAGEEDVYASAFAAVGVDVAFDAAVSRGLRRGWLCPSGSTRFATPVDLSDDDLTGDDLAGDGSADDPTGEPDDGLGGQEDPTDAGDPADEDLGGGEDPGGEPSSGSDDDPVPGGVPEVGRGGVADDGCHRQGLEALAWYAASGSLPPSVVVALGTNDASRPAARVRADLDELRGLVGGRRVFLVATATFPMTAFHTGWNDTARSWCAEDVACEFVEWGPADVADLFAPDGVHLSSLGAQERARAIAVAVVSPR